MPQKALIIITIFITSISYADSSGQITLPAFFNENEITKLYNGEIITKAFFKNKDPKYTLNTDPDILIPTTRYTHKSLSEYEMICIEKAFFPYNLTDESKLSFYNILSAYSRLSGMKYFSITEKKIKKLIIKSERIESPGNKHIKEDIIHSRIVPKQVYYFRISDNRLGNLIFRSEIYNEGDIFIVKNICIHPIKKFFLSVNKKNEYLLISFFIYNKNYNGYFFYTVNAMRIRSNFFLRLGTSESFANRIRAGTVHYAGLLGLIWQKKIRAF